MHLAVDTTMSTDRPPAPRLHPSTPAGAATTSAAHTRRPGDALLGVLDLFPQLELVHMAFYGCSKASYRRQVTFSRLILGAIVAQEVGEPRPNVKDWIGPGSFCRCSRFRRIRLVRFIVFSWLSYFMDAVVNY